MMGPLELSLVAGGVALTIGGGFMAVMRKALTIERIVIENQSTVHDLSDKHLIESVKITRIETATQQHGTELHEMKTDLKAMRGRDEDLAKGLHDVARIAAVALDRTERDI